MSHPSGSPPPLNLVSPHAGLVRPSASPLGAGADARPGYSVAAVPSSPLPHDYEAHDEPARNNQGTSVIARMINLTSVVSSQLYQQPRQRQTSASSAATSSSSAAAAAAASASPPLSVSPSGRSGSVDSTCLPLPTVHTPQPHLLRGPRRSVSGGQVTKKYRIYYCRAMTSVAQALVRLDDRFVLSEIDWNQFADGFPNLFIHDAHNVKNYHVCFLANFHNPAVFFEQFAVISFLPKLLPKSFKLFLPFFPTGTMERVSRLGEVATANTLARVLSTIPVCSKGPAQICIFDIHALQNQFYFKDTVLIRLGTCVNLLLDRIALLPDARNVNIAFPDDGAAKRFGDMFPQYPQRIICHKVRGEGDKRVVKLKEGDVQGRHCIIVDDLVQSGGTLLECAKELLRNGAACVSAFVTHAIFPKDSFRKFLPPPNCGVGAAAAAAAGGEAADSGASAAQSPSSSQPQQCLRHFFVTDTNPNVADKLRGQPPFEVLSIAHNIKEIVLDEERLP